MGAFDLGSARTVSRASASVQGVANGLRTATATSVAAMLIAIAGTPGVTHPFNGTENTLAGTGVRMPARKIVVATGASVGTYRTGASFPIRVTGTYGGQTQTEDLIVTNANGGETLKTTKPFDPQTVQVSVPGQVDANGTITVGVADIVCPRDKPFRGFRAYADGNVIYTDEDGVKDTIPALAGLTEPVLIYSVDPSTAVGLVLYL